MLDYVVNLAHSAVSAISAGVAPAFGPAATAVAIVLFTAAVRLLISPLSWAQIRGARVSPLAGCLPALVQAPFFFVMYRLFTTPNDLLDAELAGVPLGHHLGDGLGGAAGPVYAILFLLLAVLARWSSQRMRRATAEVAVTGAPASARLAELPPEAREVAERTQEQLRRVMPLLPYGTLAVAAFVPLAAGLYLVTTTAWTGLEQGVLRRYR
ncbi:YidC/Oxa1 family membrane protein insertase [Phytohabitans kaempferiae]|uniref:Membrane protein insertase YidC n=1 Tax=Phytohabitans kaempferiae TaxID=1620943 RepID=A0ABV6M7X0_9ACTN